MTTDRVAIKDIAEALGLSQSQARRRAVKEEWPFQTEVLPTGAKRRLYPVYRLPMPVRAALEARRRARMARPDERYAATPSDLSGRDLGDMTETQRRRADAYLEILAALDGWRREHPKVSKFDGYAAFAVLYNAGKVDLPDWVYEAHRSVSKNTLYRQECHRAKGATRAMGRRGGNRQGTGVFERSPKLYDAVVGLINARPNLGPAAVRRAIVQGMGDTPGLGEKVETAHPVTGEVTEVPAPSVKSFERFIAAWKAANKAVHAAIVDPDTYRDKYRFAPGSMYAGIERRNQLWEIDASPADVLCVDGRYSIYMIIDVYTRWPKVRVTKTPKAEAALLLVRDAVLDWGFPEVLRTDNGSDFLAVRFKDIVRRLGIGQHICAPFTPEQKACVERTIGTLQRGFMELQPGYIGHSVAERKAIEGRKAFARRLGQTDADAFCVELTAEELQRRIDDWVEHVYAHQPHEGLGGKTPFEVRAAYRGRISRLDGDGAGALDFLLMAPPDRPTRIMGKKGIRVGNIDYYMRDAAVLPGTEVHVRLDPDDLGRVYLYADNPWTFLGPAINPERTGLSRAEVAAEVKSAQAAVVAQAKKDIRRKMRAFSVASISELMARRGKVHTASLVPFPEAAAIRSTPDLDATAIAARARREGATLQAAPERPEEAARRQVIEAEFKRPSAPVEDPAQARFERALRAERRIAAGETVAEADWAWLTRYRETPEYRSRKRGLEDIERFKAALGDGAA